MRIAVIHSFYRSSQVSGENNTVLAQVEALREAGHEVRLIAQYTDVNRKGNPFYPVKAGFDVATGNGYDPADDLFHFRPDVCHVHNLFPNFSTRWVRGCSVPVVATVHNFRPLCVSGDLFRGGRLCTLCPEGRRLSGLKYGCYNNSRLASLPLTIRNLRGIKGNKLIEHSSAVIATSPRLGAMYLRFGLGNKLLRIVPDFCSHQSLATLPASSEKFWIAAARLTPEKGLLPLALEWPGNYPLEIYGDGPERGPLAQISDPNIITRGAVPLVELVSRMSNSLGFVLPSLWPEALPGVVLLAFEAGVPVVARAGSAGADLVEEFQAGAVYGPGHISLREALDYVSSNQEVLRKRARAAYEQNFTKEIWLKRIEKLYESVIAEHKKSSG